jgi:hypothetical protein
VDVALVPLVLVQADNDTRATAARLAIMSFFIYFFTILTYAIDWE